MTSRFSPISNLDIVRGGGRYWPAMAVNILFSASILVPMALALIAAERITVIFRKREPIRAGWRVYHRVFNFKVWVIQRVYLGCDPQLWAALTQI